MTVTAESAAYQRDDGIWVIPRGEFARDRFDYKPGQHVVFAGPTQNGKTELAFGLLEYAATPDIPAYVAVSKPRDPVTSKWAKKLGYRRSNEYPPPLRIRDAFPENRPAGYVIWPDMGSSDSAVANASAVTRALIMGAYSDGTKNKRCILVLDDTVIKSKMLGLDQEMTMVATMAGAMGISGWFFVQKPTDAGKTALWSFSQSDHIFIARDPDKRNRERYTEIGGFDSKEVERVSQSLSTYQFLYLERKHRYMCIVDKS